MSHSNHARKILIIVSGSVGAFKAAALASLLTKEGHSVRTVLTDSALKFVGTATFEGLTREKVYTSAFESGEAHSHLTLSQWADLTLVYPATANLLAKWSAGLGDDLASLVYLGHEGPIWIAPAMNPRMWRHPAILEASEKLKARGARVISPDAGRMACGEVGEGRLPEPEAMAAEIRTHFSRTERGVSILVTAGGTREPIDAVRSISNTSTGETGVRIAEALAQAGFSVTLLQNRASRAPQAAGVSSVRFDTFEEFQAEFARELSTRRYQSLVHAAAVSDYRVDVVSTGKIASDAPVELKLVPRPKLVALAREYSGDTLKTLVSFKLTVGDDEFDPAKYADSNIIIQNRLSDVRGEEHETRVFRRERAGIWKKETELSTKTALCEWMVEFMTRNEGGI